MEQDELLKIIREVGKEILENTPGLVEQQKQLDQAAQAQLSTNTTAVKELNDNLQGLPRNEVKVKQAKQRIIEKEVDTVTRWFEVKLATGEITSVSTVRENIKRYILEAVQTLYGI